MPQVSTNYRLVQNKRSPGSSFKFVIQQRFEMNKNNARNVSENLTKQERYFQNSHLI